MFGSARGFFSTPEEVGDLSLTGSDNLRLAVALLMISAAKSDGDFAESEYQLIRSAAVHKLNLPAEKVHHLLSQSDADQSLVDEAVADINSNFNPEQKVHILALVWSVVSADAIAKREESMFAAKLRNDLSLSIEQSMRARKLSEDVKIDGFKEFVEASQEMVDGAKTWKDKPTE